MLCLDKAQRICLDSIRTHRSAMCAHNGFPKPAPTTSPLRTQARSPSQFWEYSINKTRQVKWDFLFMAESLDGFRTVNGSNRHGVGYRSARQFDILNENIIYYWRDQFFAYPANGAGSAGTANPTTNP